MRSEAVGDALVLRLVPQARGGLIAAGVDAQEADTMLEMIAARVRSGQTGAVWQRRVLESCARTMSRRDALTAMFELYLANAESGKPVHTWPIR